MKRLLIVLTFFLLNTSMFCDAVSHEQFSPTLPSLSALILPIRSSPTPLICGYGVIELRLKEAQEGRYVKVHCYFDDRDEENNPIPDAYATAGNTALKLMKVFYMTESRQEIDGYDAIGNRTTQSVSSDGNTKTTNYVYYKNTSGGDSQRLQNDGTYFQVFILNGHFGTIGELIDTTGGFIGPIGG